MLTVDSYSSTRLHRHVLIVLALILGAFPVRRSKTSLSFVQLLQSIIAQIGAG